MTQKPDKNAKKNATGKGKASSKAENRIAVLEKQMEAMQVETVPIDSLRPNKYNPNRQTPDEFEKLKRSILENGFGQPVVAWRNGEIVDGEHRWRACKELGLTKITVIYFDADAIKQRLSDPETQAKLATIQFNEARGNEDMELLSKMFRDFEALGVLDKVQDQLLIDDEGVQRLLDYGGTVLDQFPGDGPGMAWEPTPTTTGQVDNYRSADGSEAQSVSKRAAAPAPWREASRVPGLGKQEEGYQAPEQRLMRRIYIFTEEESKIVDSSLGTEAARNLVALCQALQTGELKFKFKEGDE